MMSETVEPILSVSEILASIALIIGMVQKVIKLFKSLCKQVDKINRHETENGITGNYPRRGEYYSPAWQRRKWHIGRLVIAPTALQYHSPAQQRR